MSFAFMFKYKPVLGFINSTLLKTFCSDILSLVFIPFSFPQNFGFFSDSEMNVHLPPLIITVLKDICAHLATIIHSIFIFNVTL